MEGIYEEQDLPEGSYSHPEFSFEGERYQEKIGNSRGGRHLYFLYYQ
jgi:hypothetical protein